MKNPYPDSRRSIDNGWICGSRRTPGRLILQACLQSIHVGAEIGGNLSNIRPDAATIVSGASLLTLEAETTRLGILGTAVVVPDVVDSREGGANEKKRSEKRNHSAPSHHRDACGREAMH